MSMGGSQPEVLTTLTTDFGKVIDGMHRTKIKGVSHLSTALNVAQLALKHRQNKSQHQRIIVFTCSPLAEDEKSIVKLAKRMKKNTIAVDIIAFGDLDSDTIKKVEAFHENIKGSGESSHLAIIPPSPNLLSDSVVSGPILAEDGFGGGRGGMGGDTEMGGQTGGDSGGFDMGFDPNSDPELALALRMSMEEEQQRQAREEEKRKQDDGKTNLETVPEGQEGGEGGGSSSTGGGGAKGEDKDGDKKGDDKMDTS